MEKTLVIKMIKLNLMKERKDNTITVIEETNIDTVVNIEKSIIPMIDMMAPEEHMNIRKVVMVKVTGVMINNITKRKTSMKRVELVLKNRKENLKKKEVPSNSHITKKNHTVKNVLRMINKNNMSNKHQQK